jgi:hypothetical protein
MPKNMQKIARNADRKKKRNAALEAQALDDPSVLFGRAMKSLGDGWFQVAVQHPGHRNTLVESRARVGGKSVARIQVNDMVMIVLDQPWHASQGTDLIGRLEIMGTMSRKNASELFKAQRIPADLYKNIGPGGDEDDDGGVSFDDEEEGEKKPDAPDADVNIDDI